MGEGAKHSLLFQRLYKEECGVSSYEPPEVTHHHYHSRGAMKCLQ
jgi:hypothetical protein